jgi:hypothetical protein
MEDNKPEPSGLLYVFLSTLGILWLFSKLNAPFKNSENSSNPQDSTEKRKRVIYDNPSPIKVQILTSPQQEAANTEENRRDKKRFTVEKITAGLLLIYALVAVLQWRAQINAMRIQERPYITELNFVPEIKSGVRLSATIPIKNIGRSPALDFQMRMDDEIIQSTERYNPRFRNGITVWNPGTINPPPAPDWARIFYALDTLTEDQYCKIMDGTLRLYFFEEAVYKDIFGREHHTHFCGWYNPRLDTPNKMEGCETYNDTDYE